MRDVYLDLIETFLLENGFSIEDYENPLKGISQYEAIEDCLKGIIKDYYKYQNSN